MPDQDAPPPAADRDGAETCYQAAGRLAGERGSFDAESARLLRQAAEAGHARAAFHLGLLYAKGEAGLARDAAAARRWCAAAAQHGLGVAQFNLGLLEAAAEDGDAQTAGRWLLAAAANGVSEADACLDLLYQDTGRAPRPRTWEEAETRASVALARSDPDAPKTVRFAEYYVDPCLDLLARRLALRREQCEDIVQEFFLELEQPLSKGTMQGRKWKEALRARFDPGRGRFRPYLARALVNFARDWLRSAKARPAAGVDGDGEVPATIELHREGWTAELERFRAEAVADQRPATTRAVGFLIGSLVDAVDHHTQGERLGVNERTVRRDLQIAGGLLQEWLERQVAALPAPDPVADALRRGLALVPEWLFRLSADKRTRLLGLLALLHRHRQRDAAPR